MRLDKYVATAVQLTRSQAKKLILSGQVVVDAQVTTSPKLLLLKNERVVVCGEQVDLPSKQYILLNKPKGFLCSTKNEIYPSALNLLGLSNQFKLHFAGRLDVDTTGLVLISDNGQWTHKVTSPKHSHSKVYLVNLAEKLSETSLETLSHGVLLKNSDKFTAPAKVELLNDLKIRLALTEGRYHQVKRMIAAVGGHVTGLHRESIGNVSLDDTLSLGQWRHLTEVEINCF